MENFKTKITLLVMIFISTLGNSQVQSGMLQGSENIFVKNGQKSTEDSAYESIESELHFLRKINSKRQKNGHKFEGISLIKSSLTHFIMSDFRLGYEHRLNDKSSIELELGYQKRPFIMTVEASETIDSRDLDSYNAIVRYKRFLTHRENNQSSNKRLQGIYLAPFINLGSTVRTSTIFDFDDGFRYLARENQYIMTGSDIGLQSQFGMYNLDIFTGLGFTYAYLNEFADGINGSSNTVTFQNSHLAVQNVGLRLGLRIGIDPFVRPFQYRNGKQLNDQKEIKTKKGKKRKKAKRPKKTIEKIEDQIGQSGFVIKVSPWHILHDDIRFGFEMRVNEFSSIEIEGGIQGMFTRIIRNGEELEIPNNHNGIFRYKYFPNYTGNEKALQGIYIAPFINAGSSSPIILRKLFNSRESLNEVNNYGLLGADFGIQSQHGILNFDFFAGAGYSFIKSKPNWGADLDAFTVYFHNSHTAFDQVGLRLGFRVGIDPVIKSQKKRRK